MNRVMRNNPQSYIELAIEYGKLGLISDAIDVLKRYIQVVKTPHPILWYYLGSFLRQTGENREGNKYFREASKLSQEYVFPHRSQTMWVFKEVLKVYPKDAAARYYLGNLLASRRRVDEAYDQWKRCESLKSTNSTVYRNLGLVLYKAKNNLHESVKKYRKAIRLDPHDRELYWELDQVYAKLGKDKERVKLHLSRPKELQMDMKTNVRLADAYFSLGEFEETLKVLLGQEFYPWEGGLFFRHLYMWSYLYKAENSIGKGDYESALASITLAEKYPKNIKIGPPKRSKKSPILYYRGLVYEKMGEKSKARKCWEQAAKERYSGWILAETYYGLYKGKALKKLRRTAEARKLYTKVIETVKYFEGDQSARYHEMKGLCQMETGQLADAKESLERSLRLLRSNITAKKAIKEIRAFLKQ
jgi:tetratricopeptide (TPR) repeat protein